MHKQNMVMKLMRKMGYFDFSQALICIYDPIPRQQSGSFSEPAFIECERLYRYRPLEDFGLF